MHVSHDHRLHLATVVTLVTAALLSPARAADRESNRLERLQARLQAQQQRIAQLERQVAAATMQDVEARRSEALRAQIREILSQREFRESLMPATLAAGYDHGFYIRSGDDRFYLRVNGRLQFRFTHYAVGKRNRYLRPRFQRDDRTGFDIQRLRLGFRGHLYDPRLTYRFEMTADGGNNVRLRYAWANYRFSDAFQVMAGLFKIASTRGQMTSSSTLQFVDRPMTDAVFELSRGVGVKFWGHLFDKRVDWYLDVVNSFNGTANRTITPDPAELDGNPGIVFHVVWHALAENPGKDFKNQGDLAFHERPVLDLGFHYAFNEDERDRRTTRIPFRWPRRGFGVGAFGLTTSNGLQLHQFGLEAAFKYRGFSASGEYLLRILDVRRATRRPFTPLFLLTGERSTVAQQGGYLQLGWFLPIPGHEHQFEIVGRAGGVVINTEGSEGTWEYGGGLNYYIHGNKVKLQTDVVRIEEAPITSSSHSLANVNDQPLIWRVQLQVAF